MSGKSLFFKARVTKYTIREELEKMNSLTLLNNKDKYFFIYLVIEKKDILYGYNLTYIYIF